jgi:hypothetical protein
MSAKKQRCKETSKPRGGPSIKAPPNKNQGKKKKPFGTRSLYI